MSFKFEVVLLNDSLCPLCVCVSVGDIFGLCIKEEQDFAQASKLLNR